MPPAIPLIAAVAGAAASTAIGGILGSIAGFVVSTAINQIGGRAVSKKPKSSSLADAGRDLMLRSSVESHKIVYGRAKVSGPFYAETGDTGPDSSGNVITGKNTFLHMVIPVAGHEVDAFETIYLNDVALTLDANGFATNAPYGRSDTTSTSTSVTTTNRLIRRVNGTVTVTTSSAHGFSTGDRVEINEVNIAALNGTQTITVTSSTTFTYPSDGPDTSPSSAGISVKSTTITTTTLRSYVRIKTHVGTTSQVADPFLVNELPNWTSDHRLQGIAYIYCRLEWNPDAFPFDAPNVAAVVRGKKIYDPRTTLTVWSDNAALCVRDYLTSDMGYDCDESKIDDVYFISGAN
ncbi:ubiquitin-activating E1 FCCH domain-containing protein, partial [Zavarzinella formosa]|uniref:ubiquitin-activating E1 FCCH domain-containing protein n=1 Tax=Zavarzinella formosa TaxID=360055 RepID=UPI000497BD6E